MNSICNALASRMKVDAASCSALFHTVLALCSKCVGAVSAYVRIWFSRRHETWAHVRFCSWCCALCLTCHVILSKAEQQPVRCQHLQQLWRRTWTDNNPWQLVRVQENVNYNKRGLSSIRPKFRPGAQQGPFRPCVHVSLGFSDRPSVGRVVTVRPQ